LEQQKKVRTIPATLTRFTSSPIEEKKERRVAGYARVSTDHDDQFTSYEAQIDYYTNYIKSRDDWEFVKVYTDEGITGTSTKHREGFKQMVADALAGQIDLIVTKSVSRFARNTVDSLTTIRKLKDKGVECYFEKENIWTFDGKGELLITIMSSLAQEESRSISENCTWGQRKRFADGKVTVPFKRFLGYDRGPNGELIPNEKEAEIVKRIYRMFLQGMTYNGIAKQLTSDGVKTPGGKDKWSISTVRSILSNEKYKGDALLQKSYTVDYLTKKTKVNEGEIPQYYVEGDHEAIIPPETFDMVQREMENRGKGKKYHSGIHLFSSKIRCGQCGSFYGSKVWHSNDKYRKVIWRCNHKYDGGKKCSTPALTDDDVKAAFLSTANKLLATKAEVISNGKEMLGLLFQTDEMEKKRDGLIDESQVVADAVQQNITENAHTALDQTDYQKRYDDLAARYDKLKKEISELSDRIQETQSRKAGVEDFLKAFEKTPDTLTKFSFDAFTSLVDYITVYSKDDIRVTFRNGQEIKA
jgi:DNA invertase Pin-like site-specific DNA recombinase